jgi:SAM-dependent methyltransferase
VEYSAPTVEHGTYVEMYRQEDTHWWFRGRRGVVWALLRGVALPPTPRVLDAGCGTGRNILEFGVLGPVTGVDASSEAIELCRRRGLEDVQVAGLESLPFETKEFDLILACDVLEHVEDDRNALRELHRVADNGAHLVVTGPAYRWLWSDHDVQLHHFRRYTRGELEEKLRTSGWKVLRGSYYNSVLLPPVAAVRLWSRARRSTRPGHTDLDRTPAALNDILTSLVGMEASLVRRGIGLPAGSSLAMLCRRTSS